MIWRKHLWGIEFRGSIKDDRPVLIGRAWLNPGIKNYEGEPSRALLFTTREVARHFCRLQVEKNKGRTDCCGNWMFRPVRVVETVRRA